MQQTLLWTIKDKDDKSNASTSKGETSPSSEAAADMQQQDEWVCPKHGKIGTVKGEGLLEKALSLQTILQRHRSEYHCEENLRRAEVTLKEASRQVAEERARKEEFWDIDKALGKTTWYNFLWKKPLKRDLEKLRKEALEEK